LDRRTVLASLAAAPLATRAFAAELSARQIIERAHAAAGGPTWMRPRSLILIGKGSFWPKGVHADRIDVPDYRMWRVYPQASTDAHAANGMVRIDAKFADGKVYFQNAFDGVETFNQNGRVQGAQASREWSENFGFGIIRFALDPGFNLERLPDDSAEGRPMHVIRITDPQGSKTLFGIDRRDFQILWLGFATPRGWHERRYSNFYRKRGVDFTQPGLVRLFYDGIKQNEITWTDFELNRDIPASHFRLA
jgi:hypothetical protein